ncbi:YqgE/AlgH family protein [Haloglycomyces albus]|uniref:YqgE/AlgH family protein n=1 Tax=Haloglycomyces albus TaxID=526067 RepID=UPI00046D81E9
MITNTNSTRPVIRDSYVGSLLVATPIVKDPNFDRTVVMAVGQEDDGVLGLVLNRATELPVMEVLGDWGELAGDPAVMFEGGPVQPDAAIALGWRKESAPSSTVFRPVTGRLGTLDLSQGPEYFHDQLDGMRVFAGYAGWETGQLQAEINAGAWMVFDALPTDPFFGAPDDLWSTIWKRQGGMLAAMANYPPEAEYN